MRVGKKAFPKTAVRGGITFRDQAFDGLALQVFTAVTKQALGLGIDQGDAAGTVDQHHGGRCPFDDTAKGVFAQCLRRAG
ncbi:hypothetical protein SDC9_183848 [bioreactor metagenome]|uniref:Uncharacterized protein n=1 Tax=bioreactor metagenome TaxID=1076179 RepID=A0A645HDY3_9ZZZZ